MSMQEMLSHPRIQVRTTLTNPVIYDRELENKMKELVATLRPDACHPYLDAFNLLQDEDLKAWGRVTGYFDLERGYYADIKGIHVFIGCTMGSENPVGMEFRKAYLISAVGYDNGNLLRLKAPEILYEIQYGDIPREVMRALDKNNG